MPPPPFHTQTHTHTYTNQHQNTLFLSLLTYLSISHTNTHSVWPDTETYTQAITACARVGEWQRALVLLEEMVKKVRMWSAPVEGTKVWSSGGLMGLPGRVGWLYGSVLL